MDNQPFILDTPMASYLGATGSINIFLGVGTVAYFQTKMWIVFTTTGWIRPIKMGDSTRKK